MNKEFVTYEQALALKELGFDEPCFLGYKMEDLFELFTKGLVYNSIYETFNGTTNFSCTAPLKQQAFRWFREKHGMLGCIEFVEPEYGGDYGYKLYYKPGHLYIDHWNKGFKTYEEAEQACLDKLIEICKKK
jgi:hypothetical protein